MVFYIKLILECASIVTVGSDNKQIILKKSADDKEPPKTFTYDFAFGSETSQRSIYEQSAFPLVESVLDGYNGIFR